MLLRRYGGAALGWTLVPPNENKISRRWERRAETEIEILKSSKRLESKTGQRLAASPG